MFKNSVWTILVVLSLTLGTVNFESASAKPNQEEAPQVPNLLSPGNGSTASSNPPTLCAQSSDPDGNLQGIKFEVNGGGEGDHISPFIQVDGNGVACWQDNSTWSEQDHAWQARAVDSAGNQSGASGQWNIRIPVTEAPVQSETCTVNDLYTDRSAPQSVGTTIKFTVVATCSNGVNKIETFVDGQGVGTIHGSSGTISWNTNGYGAGNHVFSVQSFGNNGGTAGRSHSYDLVNQTGGQEQNNSNPNNSFGNCEAIKIGYEVFVIVKEGSAIQRRHVPNPETLDALGFSQQAINNKVFSDSELKTIGQGSDIPDVVVDPNGFNTFKSTFCPNRNAIVPNQTTTQVVQGGEVQIIPDGPQGLNGDCPASPSVLTVGKTASIAGTDLNLRPRPGVDNEPLTIIPNFAVVNVIDGPKCEQEVRWFKIEYKDVVGWAAEVGTGGKYHMYPVVVLDQIDDSTNTPTVQQDDLNITTDQPVSGSETEVLCFKGSRFGMVNDGVEWHHYVEFDTNSIAYKGVWKLSFALIPSSLWNPPDENHMRVGFRWPSDWKVILFQPSWWKICSG